MDEGKWGKLKWEQLRNTLNKLISSGPGKAELQWKP